MYCYWLCMFKSLFPFILDNSLVSYRIMYFLSNVKVLLMLLIKRLLKSIWPSSADDLSVPSSRGLKFSFFTIVWSFTLMAILIFLALRMHFQSKDPFLSLFLVNSVTMSLNFTFLVFLLFFGISQHWLAVSTLNLPPSVILISCFFCYLFFSEL